MASINLLLPAVFDPVFDYLEDNLPYPAYIFLLNAISYSTSLVSTIIRLTSALIDKNPQEWDLQTILPPIVTILAAYLALASLYRTTSWLIRLSFWFVKWGALIAALSVGAGWFAAVNSMDGGGNNALANLGSKAWEWLNGNKDEIRGSRPYYSNARTLIPERSRAYRPWKKFQDGSGRTEQDVRNEARDEARKIMNNIVEGANQVFEGGLLWKVGTAVAGSGQESTDKAPKKQKGRTRSR
ncbi:hypothetical protein FA15DRAFT_668386 [Coprinopsis marcescibilis]|uniref:Uncharacterized protein n=1 Tax=Coprinopsis marcescibilis TaxID=230819 RepID=A0A5C3KZ84_COPMA|nr:hypothetical protein FA15DRAFT_668386 [Coprinopsis marcescibilis]